MKLNISLLEKITYIYLSIPLFIFLYCWLNIIAAIVSITALTIIIIILFKTCSTNDETYIIDKKKLSIVLIVSLMWCVFTGIGGFFYQNGPDWHMKNAIFQDLINYHYPVMYQNNSVLVYYIGSMLPAAVIGKICNFVGMGDIAAKYIANFVLILWSAAGVSIVFLYLCIITKAKKYKFYIVMLLFIFYSGIDIFQHITYLDNLWHIEWHYQFQYSSNTSLLEFVFNQSIVPWILACLFLYDDKNISKYGILSVFACFYAPLPFIALCFYFIIIAITELCKKSDNIKRIFVELFDIKNILSILILMPILFFYYRSNPKSETFYIITPNIQMISFICIEILPFILLMLHKFYKNIIFLITLILLISIPMFHIKDNITHDFCMRVSIIPLFILMIFCIRYLFLDWHKENLLYKCFKTCLVLCLILGSITPLLEFSRSFYYVYCKYFLSFNVNNEPLIKDEVKTLNNRIIGANEWNPKYGDYDYYGTNSPEKHIFWKYFAKRKNQ